MYSLSKYAGEKMNTESGILAMMYLLISNLVICVNTSRYTHATLLASREKSIFIPVLLETV